jgi:peroxiredoxin Q/BCP
MDEFKSQWKQQGYPFVGLADPTHKVAELYGQQVKLLKFGRMPALMVIDKAGKIRFIHYGNSMSDIPRNKDMLNLIIEISGKEV